MHAENGDVCRQLFMNAIRLTVTTYPNDNRFKLQPIRLTIAMYNLNLFLNKACFKNPVSLYSNERQSAIFQKTRAKNGKINYLQVATIKYGRYCSPAID